METVMIMNIGATLWHVNLMEEIVVHRVLVPVAAEPHASFGVPQESFCTCKPGNAVSTWTTEIVLKQMDFRGVITKAMTFA